MEDFNKSVYEFDKTYHNVLLNARGTMFGMVMTIVDTLDLPDKQFRAIKSLIARDVDTIMFDILDRNLVKRLSEYLGYERQFGDSIIPLAEPVSSDKE